MSTLNRFSAISGACAMMIAIALPATQAVAGPNAAQKCESGKNGTVAKYVTCLHKAQQKFVSGGEVDTGKRDASIATCVSKYSDTWQALETKAGATVCPSEGDETNMKDFLDACVSAAEGALGGDPLPEDVSTCNDDLDTCDADLSTTNADLTDCNSDLSTTNADLTDCNSDLSTTNADLTDCNSDLSACESEPAARPLKTGDTGCYNAGGTSVPCAGTGYDGETQYGQARNYVDNGDGTITDTATGLMWEKLSDDGTIHDYDNAYTWQNSFTTKISNLNTNSFAGHNDWRMPNVFEMFTLVYFGNLTAPLIRSEFNSGCIGGCTVLTCNCVKSDVYWTSTSAHPTESNARTVAFDDGRSTGNGKSAVTNYIRAVRTAF